MHLGIDLGTSGVKVVATGANGAVVAQAASPLEVTRPHPLWSEQDPLSWWRATEKTIAALRSQCDLSAVRGIGLSGQMHGAVLLDASDRPLRPAILWNDGRSAEQCAVLDPLARRIAGNLAMPGFTAPKLLWVRENEKEIFRATWRVLLPKDFLRLMMTGEAISDMSDAAGTLWLDVGARRWSAELLDATGLSEHHMPALVEGTEPAGRLLPDVADAWGLPRGCVVAGGGGDNAAGAVGLGCVAPGDAFVSLGTSGVIFVVDSGFRPAPDRAVHAFCHCVPDTWHRMAVILSAAACLPWLVRLTGALDEVVLLQEAEADASSAPPPIFLPYLSGERTPHNDATACGVFFGLTAGTERPALARAVLEGISFALADGLDALTASGPIEMLSVIGGGARSAFWGRILATALNCRLAYRAGGEVGPALGAARLGRIAAGDGTIAEVCTAPSILRVQEPDSTLLPGMMARREVFRRLYPALCDEFRCRT